MSLRLSLAIAVAAVFGFTAEPNTQGATSPSAPPMPFVDDGACPFEGCVYRDWTATQTLGVIDEPGHIWLGTAGPAPKTVFTVKPGEKVTAMTGVVVIAIPGIGHIEAPRDFVVQTREFPRQPPKAVRLKPGDTVFLLTYGGEGYYRAWYHGELGTIDASEGVGIERGESSWWVKLRNSTGKIGWTDKPQTFKGRDRYGY